MIDKRLSGILLHPTSLPGSAGIGTLGPYAYAFVDWLKSANQKIWQMLPLGPTGYGDSPYASFSTFAGNPLLIDSDLLVKAGWLEAAQAAPPSCLTVEDRVPFGEVVSWKIPLLKKAAAGFLQKARPKDRAAFESFKTAQVWLESYATYMSIKEFYDEKARGEKRDGAMWNNYWPKPLAVCEKKAVAEWQAAHKEEITVHEVIQFFFYTQWQNLKKYANEAGIRLFGDIPIFVAADSADVWANQSLFRLDKTGKPLAVSGVPPDYFSETGQLWGNPLYDWDAMKKDRYSWWINRIRAMLSLVDLIRIDHFRGFEAYWAVPAGEKTAVNGVWEPGPDHDLFREIKKQLGNPPIVAEDLGVITDRVRALRDDFNLPGMKVLQFAFDLNEAERGALVNSFLPHMYAQNCVAYTGTHDNETLQAWVDERSPEELALIRAYLGENPESPGDKGDLCRSLVRLTLASTAKIAVIPLQDLYGLGNEARMNAPSTSGGINWQWRMKKDWLETGEKTLSGQTARWLKTQGMLYARNEPSPTGT